MSSNHNSITLVVAALNEEAHLEQAVTIAVEAAERWFDEYEVLVYNDGSTDNTGRIADELAGRLAHVQAIHHDQPKCLGGVIRSGFERARMHYAMWIDGKGATTAAALDEIFSRKGQADLVIPYPTNQHERHPLRRIISRCFVWLLNGLFRLNLEYYTHVVLFKTAQARRFKIHTNSYAYQAEAVIKLIKSGSSYVQVGVADHFHAEGTPTKAFRLNNVLGISNFLARTFWDVYVRRVCRSTPGDRKREADEPRRVRPRGQSLVARRWASLAALDAGLICSACRKWSTALAVSPCSR